MGITRRSLLHGGIAAGAAAGLTGCLSSTQPGTPEDQEPEADSTPTGEVEWWTINLQKNFADYIQGMIDAFEAEHDGVTIKWVDVPGQDIVTKLLAAIASQKVPDAVNYTSQTVGLFGDSMTDLSEYFTEADFGVYVPSLMSTLTNSAGQQVGIPWYNGGPGVGIYRASICSDAGYSEDTLPTTLDEALELCQKIYDSQEIYGANLMAYHQVLISEGIEMISPDKTTPTFNTPEAVEVLEKYKRFYESHAIAPGVLGKEPRQYEQSLENEKIACAPRNVSTDLVRIKENAPAVYEDVWVTDSATGPSGKQLFFGQQIFGIPAQSDNKATAAAWLKFVTNPANQLEFCKLVSIFPSAAETLTDPFFTDIEINEPQDVARKILLDNFDGMVDGALGTGNDTLLQELYDEQVRAFVSGKVTATEALDTAEKQWIEELSKLK